MGPIPLGLGQPVMGPSHEWTWHRTFEDQSDYINLGLALIVPVVETMTRMGK